MSDTPPLPRPAATSGDSLSGFFYALVAYLQMLGTLVDFSTYDEAAGYR